MQIDQLNEAFRDFAAASKSLETYYGELKERIAYLTTELETRNRQLGAALADAEHTKDYLKAILNNLEEAIVAVNPAGLVTTMNRSAEELLQTPRAEAVGRPFSSLSFSLTREDAGMLLEVRDRRYSVIVSHSDVTDAAGGLRGRVILIKDVTRLRELEVRHERNQRLIAMGEMAAKLVHEIRNPLCSIELFASMLEGDLTSPAHRELAQGITAGIGSLNAIMTNMLFFARPKKPALKTMRLDAVIDESLRLLRPMMEPRNAPVTARLSACELRGDAEMLKQVFMNILINAAQAMPDGGAVELRMEQDEGAVVVRIADTGCGIPRANLERIFDPFFTTKDSGTGLGLVIASNIMQANGGYIKVASEQGKGSVFSLYFPGGEMMDEGDAKAFSSVVPASEASGRPSSIVPHRPSSVISQGVTQ